MSKYYLAIDIGASSGRLILGHKEGEKLLQEEIYRFENRQFEKDGHVCWDTEHLRRGILEGLKECGRQGKIPVSVGIDTWGVDYVLLDEFGNVVGDAVAYRDTRTAGMDEVCEKTISLGELYGRCGIQKQPFNTLYQLLALKREHPEDLTRARSLLMIPDYFGYLLTGVMKQEYTNATTTNLVLSAEKKWDLELIEKLGLPTGLFGPLSMPGTVLGPLRKEIREEIGCDTTVVLVATHDTGSAFLAVPAKDESSVFLSSGTWSLLGVENEQPITSEESRLENFTNEGGAWYRFRYLKNIMGLWMLQSIRRELNGTEYVEGRASKHKSDRQWSFPDLIRAAQESDSFTSRINVNEERFLAPESMIDAVRDACRESGQPIPETVGEIVQCVYLSLADCYRDAISKLSDLTGKHYTGIHIVGGGCQDTYLNRLTAKATGLPVYAGPVEGTAIGNLLVQMIREGEFRDLSDARDCIRTSYHIETVNP